MAVMPDNLPWPPSVLRVAKAISVAENSPVEWNNPGSLTGEDAGSFRTNGVANSEGVWKFVDLVDGWNALCNKVNRMLSGKSHVYPLTYTLAQTGLKYSGGDPNWAKNVATYLGVPETTTLQELAE